MKKPIVFIVFLSIIIFLLQVVILYKNRDFEYFGEKYKPEYNKITNEIIDKYEIINEYYDFIPAQIVQNINGLINDLFLINRGYSDGVNEKSFVVNEIGLVGQVIKTFEHFSVVRSLFSSNINIAVEVNSCYGTLKNIAGEFLIDDLINCTDVHDDESVFTSKYNYSSANILIGSISKVDKDKLYVKLAINKYLLKYVGVINDNN